MNHVLDALPKPTWRLNVVGSTTAGVAGFVFVPGCDSIEFRLSDFELCERELLPEVDQRMAEPEIASCLDYSSSFQNESLGSPLYSFSTDLSANQFRAWRPEVASPARQHTSVYQARTELGRKLTEIRARIIASGEPLLAREQILKEVAERRGEPGEAQE